MKETRQDRLRLDQPDINRPTIKGDIHTVFVDIDCTLVSPREPSHPGPSTDVLIDLVAVRHGVTVPEARRLVKQAEAGVRSTIGQTWPFGILSELKVGEDELWAALSEKAKATSFVYPDAVDFLKGLRRRPGVRIYPATTNPALLTLAKLAAGGLATQQGSPYLDGVFGGEEVYAGGKSTPGFFRSLLKRTQATSDTTLMVGDLPEVDLALARAAGWRHVALVNRSQRPAWISNDDGALYVRQLTDLLGLLP